ncbi:outer membrane lipoprotein-sorting protein [Trinickia dabaoshanensis]|uniref:Outer membrane lipoprotein-sorting protein n=1 Tax=Trinickia dabaoshanensis TaxID=564714 RepID=A0A2N7VI84_9BURK|nr:outer membrane lipoprotein-sorting protein [Trinickia dabaoshanensis]PMS16865.1 outer membrane lipoprotein-sorting protein [Trinickia dabaoshanensis]
MANRTPSRWLAGIFLSVSIAAVAAPNAQQLLEASDAMRNPDRPFKLTTTLIDFHGGRQTDEDDLTVYSKIDPDSGQYRSLIRFESPARDLGKLLLKSGLDLWFYDPSSQASVRISPQQRLLGQAANGDVVTVNWAHDYAASFAGEQDIPDGDRKLTHCYELALLARSEQATYRSIDLWLDVATQRPVKARFHAESGTVLKVAYFRRFQEELGAIRPTEVVIIDGLSPDWITVMRYSNYAWKEIPEAWMQRDYLARFSPN